MANKTKNVLSLDSKDAMDFFLKSEQYHGFELPEYFIFDELLQNDKNAVDERLYEVCLENGVLTKQLPFLDSLLGAELVYICRKILRKRQPKILIFDRLKELREQAKNRNSKLKLHLN